MTLVVYPLCISNVSFKFTLTALPCEECSKLDNVALVMTSWGGHIGFIDGFIPTAPFLMERLFIQYASAILPMLMRNKKTAWHKFCDFISWLRSYSNIERKREKKKYSVINKSLNIIFWNFKCKFYHCVIDDRKQNLGSILFRRDIFLGPKQRRLISCVVFGTVICGSWISEFLAVVNDKMKQLLVSCFNL